MKSMMSQPAPRRCSRELPDGKYYTESWTLKDVTDYQLAGGWFRKGYHDFADRAAAKAAGVKDE